jgi:DNA replication protein DnaC
VDAVSDDVVSFRCPACRAELDFPADWRATPGESERAGLEWHIEHKHADKAADVRRRYLLDASALPSRFWNPARRPTDELGAAVWKEAALWYQDCFGDSNLILYGGTGVGKSTLAARMLLQRISLDVDDELTWVSVSYWLHVGDFARRARRLLATGKSAELAEILDRAQHADYLFLDDLGSERPTEFVRDLIADVIEYRYDHSYGSIVVTTNYTPDELAARLGGDDPMIGDRLVGRLCEGAFQLHYAGPDRRLPDIEVESNVTQLPTLASDGTADEVVA